jgi:hypothetical protein
MISLCDNNNTELQLRMDGRVPTYIGEPGQEYQVLVTVPSLSAEGFLFVTIDGVPLRYSTFITPGKARRMRYTRFPTSSSTGTTFVFGKPCASTVGPDPATAHRRRSGLGRIDMVVYPTREKTPEEKLCDSGRTTTPYGPIQKKKHIHDAGNRAKFWEKPGLCTTPGGDGKLSYVLTRTVRPVTYDTTKWSLCQMVVRYDTHSNLNIRSNRDQQQRAAQPMPRLEVAPAIAVAVGEPLTMMARVAPPSYYPAWGGYPTEDM